MAEDKSKRPSPRRAGSDVKRHVGTLVALIVILAICVIGSTPLGEKITQGLDIQGGVSVVMTATKPNNEPITSEDMRQATTTVQNRVNSLGASEATVQQQGSTSILVQIPGASNPEEALKTIGRTGLLEFVNLYDIKDVDALNQINAGKENVKLKPGSYTAFLTGDAIKNTAIGPESQGSAYYAVSVRLDSEGAKKFADVTRELAPIHGRIAIVLDGVVNSAPTVQSVIPDGQVQITGRYTLEGAQSLKAILDSGSLPVNLTYSESRVVGPTLGHDSLVQGLMAISIGLALVAVYLFFFYSGMGLLTAASLIAFAIIYLGILAALSHFGVFALSLPGIAGIVLTIGMAADSSILVLERFREELRMGHSIRAAATNGVRHGIGTSIDADIVSLVSAIALFFIAIGPVKGFGMTLALGIICDIIVMFIFKAPALQLLSLNQIPKHPKFWGVATDLEEGRVSKAAAKSGKADKAKGESAHA